MAERRLRRPPRAAAAIVAGLALGSLVVSSAASLGGLSTGYLGAAAAVVRDPNTITLAWTPEWVDGGWVAAGLTIKAPQPGAAFEEGDTGRVAIINGSTACEFSGEAVGSATDITIDMSAPVGSCEGRPSLTVDTTVAVVVTGAGGETLYSNIGNISGSIASFAATDVTKSAAKTEADAGRYVVTVDDDRIDDFKHTITTAGNVTKIVVDVPGVSSTRLNGAIAYVATPDGRSTTLYWFLVEETENGAKATLDVSNMNWSADSTKRIEIAISLPQSLDSAAAPDVGVVLGSARIDTGRASHDGSGIDPVDLTPGLEYMRAYPFGRSGSHGEEPNAHGFGFYYKFTVTNTTGSAMNGWWIEFNTNLAPMRGVDPDKVELPSDVQSEGVDAKGVWRLEHTGSLASGASQDVYLTVPIGSTPAPEASKFSAEVSVEWAGEPGESVATLVVDARSSSEFNTTWEAEFDLAELLAPAAGPYELNFPDNRIVVVSPVDGTTRFHIKGQPGQTEVLSQGETMRIEFATFDPSDDTTGDADTARSYGGIETAGTTADGENEAGSSSASGEDDPASADVSGDTTDSGDLSEAGAAGEREEGPVSTDSGESATGEPPAQDEAAKEDDTGYSREPDDLGGAVPTPGVAP